ncbi:MAG: hypothetical protein ACM3JB_02720 [Acidobacteriaceae bacterium]
MSTASQPADVIKTGNDNRWTYLLCLPGWAVIAFCVAVVVAIRIDRALVDHLISKPAVYLPTACVIASPFCWLWAAKRILQRWRRERVLERLVTSFVALSGVVMVASWVVLAHFARGT